MQLTNDCPIHGRYDITHDTCPICEMNKQTVVVVCEPDQKRLQDALAEIVHAEGFKTDNDKVIGGAARLFADLINALDPDADATVGIPNRMDDDDESTVDD